MDIDPRKASVPSQVGMCTGPVLVDLARSETSLLRHQFADSEHWAAGCSAVGDIASVAVFSVASPRPTSHKRASCAGDDLPASLRDRVSALRAPTGTESVGSG